MILGAWKTEEIYRAVVQYNAIGSNTRVIEIWMDEYIYYDVRHEINVSLIRKKDKDEFKNRLHELYRYDFVNGTYTEYLFNVPIRVVNNIGIFQWTLFIREEEPPAPISRQINNNIKRLMS